jgi:hypothetical protein
LKSLYNPDGGIDYERVKEIANRIVSGTGRIVRLDDGEERGRILGGQRNVEASLIAGAEEGAGPEGESRRSAIQRSEEALEAYARNEGIWLDDLNSEYSQVAEGFEAIVYEDPNPDLVLKAARFADSSPLQTLDDRISLFNTIFAETAYQLEGFTRDTEGYFRFVLRQPFIIGVVGQDNPKALARMRESGLFATPDPEKFTNSNHSVRDVHSRNYIITPDRVFVIDAITSLNSPDIGGSREYLPFRVELFSAA